MRARTLALTAALSAGLIQTGDAFAPVGKHRGAELPVVTAGRAPRAHRDIGWGKIATGDLAGWRQIRDRDTDVPVRMWGPSIAAPGASSDPAIAEATARAFLAAHIDLIAPGAAMSDFTLSANVVDPRGAVRTVAFVQHARGLAVIGGSIGVAFEKDHLVMVSSTALPHVTVRMPGGALATDTLGDSARAWLAQGGHGDTRVRGRGDRVILPIVRPRGHSATPDIEYRVVETVDVETTREPGRWHVWLDAADAAPVARQSTLMFASGTVTFNVPDRYPGSTRGAKPAAYENVTVNGAAATTALDGTITWTGAAAATVVPSLIGTVAKIINQSGSLVTTTLTVAVAGQAVWDLSTVDTQDAQLDAYVFENTVKHFVVTQVNPSLAWLAQQESVYVNENQTCNAFSTGDDIHFFIAAPGMCENTGRIADVVYHETGHSVHYNSIIPGQGMFDSSLSEGLADTMAVSITGDPGLGRGFDFTNNPLRDLNPTVKKKYPQDYDGEPHDDGEIIGETLWDTRVALQTKLGQAAGFAQFIKVYYSIMQRSPDIPSSFAEALLGDDDDGDLGNGTPNECELAAAFAAHGLADPSVLVGLAPPTRDNFTVTLNVTPPQGSCPTAGVQSAVLDWNPRGATGGQIALADGGNNSWTAVIPTQPDGTVVEYSVTVTLSDGTTQAYPDNKADPKYQFYVGPVTPIKCWDFETGAADWTHSATPASSGNCPTSGCDEWVAGMPLGVGGDPKTAHGGTSVFGIDLGADDGMYSASVMQFAESADVDLGGATKVRLQYWRWLNVEDAAYDQGTISANGTAVWTNLASPGQPTVQQEINHTDREWRFQDVDLSAQAAGGKIKLRFELDSDPGVQLGGWTIDDVCIVTEGAPGPTCGNGVVENGEQCDDGNTVDGDGCSSTCQDETGSGSGGKGKASGGCCDAGTNPAGAATLAVLVIGLLVRRRRRRSA